MKRMKKSIIAVLLGFILTFTACGVGDHTSSPDFSSSSNVSGSTSDADKDSANGSNDSSNDSTDGSNGSSNGENTDSSSGNTGNNSGNEDSSGEDTDDGEGDEPKKDCIDADDNGFCDECKESVTITFDFYAVNDLHGKFDDTDTQPGVDELSTYLKNAKTQNENTVLLASGDMWQGSAESNLTKGKLLTDWMSEMEFSSMTLGNHEFDWGCDFVESNSELAEFPFLAINVYNRTTNTRVDYCAPSVTVEQNGVKIGIIGAIGDCYSSISADKVSEVYFKTGSELTSLVKAESQKLRNEGADFIVYSLHDGYGQSYSSTTSVSSLSYYDVALSDGYVDLVFEGHSHQSYVLKDKYGVYHLQGGGDNDGITHAEVTVNFAGGTSTVNEAEYLSTSTYASLEDHPIVDELLEKYAEEIAIAGKVLGTNDLYRNSNYLCDLVAQLYYEKGVETWGSQYDIALGGGFLKARSPYDLAAGEVVYGDLQSIFPFDNQIVLCSISGYYLRKQFFETSNSSYHIAYGEYGASIKANIDINATYYIITDTYTSVYGPNHLTEVARLDETTFARDLLADYIEAGGLTTVQEDIKLTSIPQVIAIGNSLGENVTTSESYFVKGEIIGISNATYGNATIRDESGNTLYVYGIYDKSGGRYDSMTEQPQVGDTVILQAPIQKYVYNGTTTIELYHAALWSIE